MDNLSSEALNQEGLEVKIPEALAGQRFDLALTHLFTDYSRSWLQRAIRSGQVTLNERPARPKSIVKQGDNICLKVYQRESHNWHAQALPLNIVYEDDDIIVVDKPAQLIVHPGASNYENTLANALLHHRAQLTHIPRAGIVHRLDKDTSGLMVVACSNRAHTALVAALSAHAVTRGYYAIVAGQPIAGGVIDAPIGRSSRHRTRMAITSQGKPARTHYRIAERFRRHTALSIRLETGRTHQIRVHLTHIGFPIIGDPQYRGRTQIPSGTSPLVINAIVRLSRQVLHAQTLTFTHPQKGIPLAFESPLPETLMRIREELRRDISQDNPSA